MINFRKETMLLNEQECVGTKIETASNHSDNSNEHESVDSSFQSHSNNSASDNEVFLNEDCMFDLSKFDFVSNHNILDNISCSANISMLTNGLRKWAVVCKVNHSTINYILHIFYFWNNVYC